jgi:hypothetical protein
MFFLYAKQEWTNSCLSTYLEKNLKTRRLIIPNISLVQKNNCRVSENIEKQARFEINNSIIWNYWIKQNKIDNLLYILHAYLTCNSRCKIMTKYDSRYKTKLGQLTMMSQPTGLIGSLLNCLCSWYLHLVSWPSIWVVSQAFSYSASCIEWQGVSWVGLGGRTHYVVTPNVKLS